MPNFFQRPAIPRVPYPEPAGYDQLRALMMNRYFQQMMNPYGMSGQGMPPRPGPTPYSPYPGGFAQGAGRAGGNMWPGAPHGGMGPGGRGQLPPWIQGPDVNPGTGGIDPNGGYAPPPTGGAGGIPSWAGAGWGGGMGFRRGFQGGMGPGGRGQMGFGRTGTDNSTPKQLTWRDILPGYQETGTGQMGTMSPMPTGGGTGLPRLGPNPPYQGGGEPDNMDSQTVDFRPGGPQTNFADGQVHYDGCDGQHEGSCDGYDAKGGFRPMRPPRPTRTHSVGGGRAYNALMRGLNNQMMTNRAGGRQAALTAMGKMPLMDGSAAYDGGQVGVGGPGGQVLIGNGGGGNWFGQTSLNPPQGGMPPGGGGGAPSSQGPGPSGGTPMNVPRQEYQYDGRQDAMKALMGHQDMMKRVLPGILARGPMGM